MNRIRRWLVRLINLTRTDQNEREFQAELQAHLDLHIEDNLRQGMTPTEARRVARARLGGVDSVRERCRDVRSFVVLDDLGKDLRYSVRGLLKSPTVTLVALLSLAIGIGVNTAVFSVVDAMVFRAFPYDHPERLVMVRLFDSLDPTSTRGPLRDEYRSWKPRTDVFEAMAFHNDFSLTVVSSEGRPTEELRGLLVSTNLFETLGVDPLLGRGFLPEDAQPDPDVVVLSHSMWQRRYGGSPGVIGDTLWLDDTAATIVGVMPPGFYYWDDNYPYWLPSPVVVSEEYFGLSAIARLASGVTVEQAQVAMDTLAAQLPETSTDWSVRLVPHHEFFTRDLRPTLLVLWGAVAFVLLIASANVGGVLLARASSRAQEIGMRLALGASRWRVARLLLSEGLLLALGGGALGSGLAYAALEMIKVLDPATNPALAVAPTFPRLHDAGVDGAALAYTLLISLLTAALCSLVPALQGCRLSLVGPLKDGGRASTSGSGRLRSGLVVAQVALALVLVTGAGLMLHTMRNLSAVDLGFNPKQVLMFEMPLNEDRSGDDNALRVNAFFARMLQGLENVPGVEFAATVQNPPLSHWNTVRRVTIHGAQEQPVVQQRLPVYRAVRGGYFDVMEIPLLQGRTFSDLDSAEAPWVVVINRAMAETYWPNQNPIGRQLTIPPFIDSPEQRPSRTVVGVVDDVNNWSVQQPVRRAGMYVPAVQGDPIVDSFIGRRMTYVLVRTAAAPVSLAPEVRRVVAQLDPDQSVAGVFPMQQLVDIWTDGPRFYTVLTVVFAVVALVLSLIGIYGVMAYSVARHTHEIGIRMALGARRAQIARLVASRGLLLGVGGVAVGMTGAFWLTSLLQSFRGEFGGAGREVLFGVSATDPATFATASLLLLGAVLLACYNPARAAMKVDPMVALRHE